MLTTLLLLAAAHYTHGSCTIPADASGPANGQLGTCSAGSTIAVGDSCSYCKFCTDIASNGFFVFV